MNIRPDSRALRDTQTRSATAAVDRDYLPEIWLTVHPLPFWQIIDFQRFFCVADTSATPISVNLSLVTCSKRMFPARLFPGKRAFPPLSQRIEAESPPACA